jgi:uncharacterized membrane protein
MKPNPSEGRNGKAENILLLVCAAMVIAGLVQASGNIHVLFEQGYLFVLAVSAFVINLI